MNNIATSVPTLPDGCGYEGNDFGASYPDSKCYGGRLYDLDNCDDNGNLYEPLNFLPCPQCNHAEWLEQFREKIEMDGYIASEQGKEVNVCPFPLVALRYPEDNEWLKECWMRGYNEFKKESTNE